MFLNYIFAGEEKNSGISTDFWQRYSVQSGSDWILKNAMINEKIHLGLIF